MVGSGGTSGAGGAREVEISTAEAGRAGDVAVESNRGGDGAGAPGAMEGAPDRGWRAWATVAATFSVFMHAVAIHYLFSMFYPEFLGEFQATRSGAAWAGSVSTGVMFLSSLPAGLLVDFTGSERFVVVGGGLISGGGLLLASWASQLWQIYIVYGLIAGLGHGLSVFSCPTMLSKWFDDRLGFASGVGTSGSGFGTLLYGQVLPLLITRAGWRDSLRLYSLVSTALTIVPPALAFRTPGRHQRQNTPSRAKGSIKLGSVFSHPGFAWLACSLFVASFGWEIPYVHITKLLQEQQLSDRDASVVLTCVGAGGLAGRIALMYTADRVGRGAVAMGCMVLLGTVNAMLLPRWPLPAKAVLGVSLGTGTGVMVASIGPLASSLVVADEIAQAIGLLYSTLAIGVVLGPPIGGMLYTQTGSYVAGFATASASWFAAALLFVPVLWRNESLLRGRRHPQS